MLKSRGNSIEKIKNRLKLFKQIHNHLNLKKLFIFLRFFFYYKTSTISSIKSQYSRFVRTTFSSLLVDCGTLRKDPRDFLYLRERPPEGRVFQPVTCLSTRYRSQLHWITTVAGLAADYHSSYTRFLVFDVR